MASVSDQGQREEKQIAELLRDEEFHYQSIILPGGVRTSGNDRSNTLDKILPADMTGKTVLDIGCRYGFFSFEAARREVGRRARLRHGRIVEGAQDRGAEQAQRRVP